MTRRSPIYFYILAAAFAFLAFGAAAEVQCFQGRDHLTEQEAELIRAAQILDKRIEVFIKAVDRRLIVISGGEAVAEKQLKKDAEAWGPLPAGTRAELFGDIAKIFDEAITNIDDVSARDEKNPLIPKALRKLSAAASRTVEQLKLVQTASKGDAETAAFESLVSRAEEIVEAAGKLPPEEKKQKGKNKTEKPKETN